MCDVGWWHWSNYISYFLAGFFTIVLIKDSWTCFHFYSHRKHKPSATHDVWLPFMKYQIAGHDSSTGSSSNLSLGEVIDLNEAPIQVHSGVPPIELERKLHELLESRQQERIKELEAALECTRQKLSEKEREAMWWKATALHMSHHAPESPRLS